MKKIVIDLDGTLIHTDSLHEAILQLLKNDVSKFLHFPTWLLSGKSCFKNNIARCTEINPATLPYNLELIAWIKDKKNQGHEIILCTASNIKIALKVSEHLQLFDAVIASKEENIAGKKKKSALDLAYGEGNYIYAGNSSDDLDVWVGSSEGVTVNASPNITKKAQEVTKIICNFPPRKITARHWSRVLRVHQWTKNALVFVPLLAAHQIANMYLLGQAVLAFVCFSLCASSVYILNDLLDLESDRQHPRKRQRPFASGSVPVVYGIILAPLFALLSLTLALAIHKMFAFWLLVYLILTVLYSFKIKKIVLVDCLTLAGLYTLRIIAGAAATSISLSFWLLSFSVFIFLSLAFVKRSAEIQTQINLGNEKTHGRDYMASDAPLIQIFGVASGYSAVLVLALYLNGQTATTLYSFPEFIWGAVPLTLFWISWVWLKTHRGLMNDDPLLFAVRDRVSWAVFGGVALSFAAATFVG